MRLLSAFAVCSSRGTGRFGYPGTGSSTHSTHSGGLSQRSRSSTSRRAASAMAIACGSLAYSDGLDARRQTAAETGMSQRWLSVCSADRCPYRARCLAGATKLRGIGCGGFRMSCRRHERWHDQLHESGQIREHHSQTNSRCLATRWRNDISRLGRGVLPTLPAADSNAGTRIRGSTVHGSVAEWV